MWPAEHRVSRDMLKESRELSVNCPGNTLEPGHQRQLTLRLRYFDAEWNGRAISKVDDSSARQATYDRRVAQGFINAHRDCYRSQAR